MSSRNTGTVSSGSRRPFSRLEGRPIGKQICPSPVFLNVCTAGTKMKLFPSFSVPTDVASRH